VVDSSTPSTAVTSTGTVTATIKNQNPNIVLAGPNGGGAAPSSFRALVLADLPSIACGDLSDDGAGCTAGAASTSTAGIVKLNNVGYPAGWMAAIDPNNAVVTTVNQASTITAIVGRVESQVGGATTVSVYKAPSGTACSAGTVLHSGSFNANGTAATNQTLTVTVSSLSAGDSICLQTTGGAAWTGGAGIGSITVFFAPS
jgi:hypothetical protein